MLTKNAVLIWHRVYTRVVMEREWRGSGESVAVLKGSLPRCVFSL